MSLLEWNCYLGWFAARLSGAHGSGPESIAERRFPRKRTEAVGSFSFGSVFFGDSKKMNSVGGPKPAGFVLFRTAKPNQDQGRGVAPPLGAFISLFAQRNEAKKCARTPCPSGSLHFVPFCSSEKNSLRSDSFPRIPAKLHCSAAASHGTVGKNTRILSPLPSAGVEHTIREVCRESAAHGSGPESIAERRFPR